MKPAESFVDQPIRAMQTMLRTIASIEPSQMNVMPDGIYGSQTAAAVRSFQRRQGLPQTGVADQTTHDRLVQEYERAWIEADKAQPIQVNLDPGQVLHRGEQNNVLYLVQSMLTVLHLLLPEIPAPGHTGILDPATAEAIAAFQTYAGLPPTGELDKRTWKDLALYFALAADQLENKGEI
jgi:peptidoglycan hydrolase-like protein with peptidoglycan-binding domain